MATQPASEDATHRLEAGATPATATPIPGYSVLTRELLWLAGPMVGVTLSRMLMGFIDFVMVSQLGTAAQAAISPCTLLLFIIACAGMGIGQGVQAFASQAEGRGEPQRAGAYLWQALYIAAAAALLSAPIAWYLPEWFPRLVGGPGKHPPEVQAMEIAFLRYALWGIGPMVACAGLECFWNGIKRPMVDLVAIGVSLLTLAFTNYVLIFGKLGFPEMGIAGSGIATLLAWCVRLVVLAAPLSSRVIGEKYGVWRAKALLTEQWHGEKALLTEQWHGEKALLTEQWHEKALLTEQWHGEKPLLIEQWHGDEHTGNENRPSLAQRARPASDRLGELGFRPKEMRELLVVGGPISFQWLVDIGAWFVFLQFLMPPFGESAMAAANMVIQFMHLSFMPCLGIGMALTTQVGNAVGAGDAALAIVRVRVARRLVLGYMGLMMVLFVVAGGHMASWLSWESDVDLRGDVLRLAAQMAVWAGLFQLFDGLCIIYSFAARGAGDTRVPALWFAVCCWGIFVLGGYMMMYVWPESGIHGLWLMCTLYITVLGVLLMRRFHRQKWRAIRIFSGEAGSQGVHGAVG